MKSNKPDNKNNKMVARQDPPQNTFRVVKNEPQEGPDADALSQEAAAVEAELQAVEEGIEQRRQQLALMKAQAAEAVRQDKLNQRANLLEDATDWRDIARTHTDPVTAKEFLRKAKDAEAEATRLGVELNLEQPAATPEEPSKSLIPLSSNRAIQVIIGLFMFFVALTYFFGAPLEADPMNAIGQSMMKNAPIRALLSFTLTFLTVLVSMFLIRICFPQFYRIWHNRINSERSLETLLAEAPAWAVLLSLLGLFYTFMQLFASFYQALYA